MNFGENTRKRGLKLPEVLTPDEQAALMAQPNKRAPTGLRNLLMIRLMLNIGLRCSEVLNLGPYDINLTTGRLVVKQGKGNKDRVLWLGEDDLELLRRWQERRPESTYVFCTLKGQHILTRYVRKMVARYAKKAGIAKRVHPHLLRHTMATDLYKQTKDLRLVQKILGHASITTTTIYTHLVDEDVENALKAFRNAS